MKEEFKKNFKESLKQFWEDNKQDIIVGSIIIGLGCLYAGGYSRGEKYGKRMAFNKARQDIVQAADNDALRIRAKGLGQALIIPHPITAHPTRSWSSGPIFGNLTVGDIIKPEMMDKLGFDPNGTWSPNIRLDYVDFIQL